MEKLYFIVLVPLLLNVLAAICGWSGRFVGYSLDVLAFWCWSVLLVVYIVRLFASCSPLKRVLNILLILLCAFGFFCGQRPFLNAFEARLKREYPNVAVIRDWSGGILKSIKSDNYPLPKSAWPDWVRIKNFPEPSAICVFNDSNYMSGGEIRIMWGGGLSGQWGLQIESPKLVHLHGEWADGIYFYAFWESEGFLGLSKSPRAWKNLGKTLQIILI